jgi:dGTPase
LAGVTQVVSPAEGHVFHNRLTHTLEVAQIARRLAENLLRTQHALAQRHGGLDADVVESAALAHDLGHPPFGHVAEKELDRVVVNARVSEGYEGNAQSFRIVTKLAVRGEGTPEAPGLDLTRATMNACLKYPWLRQTSGKKARKWGYYHTEQTDFDWARQGFNGPADQPCLEAQVMTWADDIGYSVHDTEDFFRAGLIPLDRIINSNDEVDRFLTSAFQEMQANEQTQNQLRQVFQEFRQLLVFSRPYLGTQSDRQDVRAYTSTQIGRYLTAVTIRAEANARGEVLDMPEPMRQEIELVKHLTRYYVIDSASLASQQHGQRRVIRTLFKSYLGAAEEREWRMLPAAYREQIRMAGTVTSEAAHQEIVRLIADMIAEMTDYQALNLHHRMTGQVSGSVLDPIIR